MAESVGLSVQPVDAFSKISQLLQIRGAQQQLRSATAEAQMQEQTAAQRAALANYDWNKHVGADGTIDLNSLSDPELRAAAGDQYLDIVSKAVAARDAQLQTKRTMLGLTGDRIEALGNTVGALLSDPDIVDDKEGKGIQKVNQALQQYYELYGEDVLPVIAAYAPQLKKLPPGKLPGALRNIQLQAMDVAQQKAAQAPHYVARGGSVLNVNPAAAADVPGEIGMTLPPGASILTDARGRQFVFDPQTNKATAVGTGRGGGVREPATNVPPSASIFEQPDYQGQAADVERFQTEVDTTRQTAANVGQNRNINRNILKLSKETTTGPLATYAQKIGIVGQVAGDNFQELSKFLEKNALANMQAMGGPASDARLEAATAATGSTKFNREALQAVTKFNDATNSALEQYRTGLDKAVGTRTPDYRNLPQFKADWAANFDVDIFRYENAVRDGDQEEIESLRQELKGNPERARELQRKAANIRKLTEKGSL